MSQFSDPQLKLKNLLNLDLIKSIPCAENTTTSSFEHAFHVYLNKPQVVNKWLAGSITLPLEDNTLKSLLSLSTKYQLLAGQDLTIQVREFLPKSVKIFSGLKYLVAYDRQTVLFSPLTDPNDENRKYPTISLTHLIEFTNDKLHLYIDRSAIDRQKDDEQKDKIEFQIKWLTDTLLPKLNTWCQNIKTDDQMSSAKLATLTLYPNMVNDYSQLYQQLKEIYWDRFAAKWFEVTGTNPEKFIHEDISIAAYFILVWRHFNIKVTQFVDIGCGNGLLVYILNDQGFKGYGIDMRSRRIWDNELYQSSKIRLIEQTIDPQVDTFKDCDWLIGNHSDELSPWLPIICAKSRHLNDHLTCSFLLIPCCLFDFYSKYEVKKKGESRYDTYLNYLEKICYSSEFDVFRDKLRIPSTRNVCLIGINQPRTSVVCSKSVDAKFAEKICNLIENSVDSNNKVEFKPRDLTEEQSKAGRNCTKNIEKSLQNFIVKCVLTNLCDIKSECVLIKKYDGKIWNAGRTLTLGQVVGLFDQEIMLKLKQECGGLKTLLKNFHQLFCVVGGNVRLKIWKSKRNVKSHEVFCELPTEAKVQKLEEFSREVSKNKAKKKVSVEKLPLKTKQCLFDSMHPDGCLLPEDECDFKHN